MMKITIWGPRGSMPTPGPATVRFGGNTACIEVRCDNRLIIIDAGSGIRRLGDKLMKEDIKKGPINADIFLSHTHWDHILGVPMFTPIYVAGTKLRIYGPISYEDDSLEQIIGNQLSYRYWPVRQEELAAEIEYKQIKETTMDLGDGIFVTTKYLNHPILCLGYRIEFRGKTFVTVFDNEPFYNVFPTDPDSSNYSEEVALEGEAAAQEGNEKLIQFCQNADLLIHDAQYTAREYNREKKGWGHSSFEFAINVGHKSSTKNLLFFHHDPNRSDVDLQELENYYQSKIYGKTKLKVEMAREGKTFDL